ncbi:MAG: LAGLIDADG family homing endonuclease [Candidatus Aenigmatarchaeota archaeon]
MNKRGILIEGRRIKFLPEKQRYFIKLVKSESGLTWLQLSNFLDVSTHTVRVDWLTEKSTLPESHFNKMITLIKSKSKRKIIEEKYVKKILPMSWGRSLGGKNSIEKIRKRNIPNPCKDIFKNDDFSELVGIILGDGSVSRKVVEIDLENPYELEYADTISKFFHTLFQLKTIRKIKSSVIILRVNSIGLVEFLSKIGIKSGNKTKNNVGVPSFIKRDKYLAKRCLRGLVDTDGGLFAKDKKSKRAFVEFKSKTTRLRRDFDRMANMLGFRTSRSGKIAVRIQNQDDVIKYMKEIGSNNPKIKLKIHNINKFGVIPTTSKIKEAMRQ